MSETYPGGELAAFAQATVWKRYLASQIGQYLGARVLEVGAGLGANSAIFQARSRSTSWVCLEPDRDHVRAIEERVARGELPASCTVKLGTVRDLDERDRFDTILYVDVLEHIADDAGELRASARRLSIGGHLVVMSPAHQGLYSPFDAAIGHHRRYTKRTLRDAAPADLALVRLRYLDSVGLFASAANRIALAQSAPTLRQVLLWDRVMVRASRWIDPALGYRVGKSVLGVWRRVA